MYVTVKTLVEYIGNDEKVVLSLSHCANCIQQSITDFMCRTKKDGNMSWVLCWFVAYVTVKLVE